MAKIIVVAADADQQKTLAATFKDVGERAKTNLQTTGLSQTQLAAYGEMNAAMKSGDPSDVLAYITSAGGKPRKGAPVNDVIVTTNEYGGIPLVGSLFGMGGPKSLDTQIIGARAAGKLTDEVTVVYAAGRDPKTTLGEVEGLLLRTVHREIDRDAPVVSAAAQARYNDALSARATTDGSLHKDRLDPGYKGGQRDR
ncbi:MAG: hypothetical protein EB060_07885 [Proteobacteria bacterium]|nr:hypothetical protein [Pseudomonadota bacterium]